MYGLGDVHEILVGGLPGTANNRVIRRLEKKLIN